MVDFFGFCGEVAELYLWGGLHGPRADPTILLDFTGNLGYQRHSRESHSSTFSSGKIRPKIRKYIISHKGKSAPKTKDFDANVAQVKLYLTLPKTYILTFAFSYYRKQPNSSDLTDF